MPGEMHDEDRAERIISSMAQPTKIEIHFVTGKGGVGKSTVAAALALNLANSGKKTLLVELGNQSFYKDYIGLEQVGYQPIAIKENLSVALWSGQDCLKEYARYLLKVEALYHLLFENNISKTLINIAPGLPELAITGKITSGPPRNVGPEIKFDSIVIDAFATGHFIALLRAPRGMSEIIKIGPMSDQSKGILKVLTNKEICHYWVVSIPEELPIQEGLELSKLIEEEVKIKPKQILNKIIQKLDKNSSAIGSDGFLKFSDEQIEKQNKAIQDLTAYNTVQLPMIFEFESWKIIEALALALNKGIQQ